MTFHPPVSRWFPGEAVEYAWERRRQLAEAVFKDASDAVTRRVAYQHDATGRKIGKQVDDGGDDHFDRDTRYVHGYFRMADSKASESTMISELLDGNRRFIASEFNHHLEHYQGIARGQSPTILWIGCSDSRVSEDVVTGSKPGTIFVHRNIANIVAYNDVNIAAILEYALVHLKIRDVVVCGHTRCGGIAAIEDGVQENYIADWLLIASGAKEKVDAIALERHLTREEKLNLLIEENVRLQIKHLEQFALIKSLARKGEAPAIHGWVYSVETGEIKTLVEGKRST